MVAGVLAWGAATDPHYAAWIPTFEGLFVGAICFGGALLCGLRLWVRSTVPFRVRKTPLLAGLVACSLLILILGASAAKLDNPSHYKGTPYENLAFTDPEDNPRPSSPAYVGMVVLIVFPGPISWMLFGTYRFYAGGIAPVSSVVPPVDAIGEIMKTEGAA
jgi:hypothetical protein